MEDEFLIDCFINYIERKIDENFIDSIIDKFHDLKECCAQLQQIYYIYY